MRERTKKLHYRKNWRKHWWKANFYVHKIGYWYPDGTFSDEIKPCVWKDWITEEEREGWPACTLQLTCPYMWNYVSDRPLNPGGRCNQECRDQATREAIEAFITLLPDVY